MSVFHQKCLKRPPSLTHGYVHQRVMNVWEVLDTRKRENNCKTW